MHYIGFNGDGFDYNIDYDMPIFSLVFFSINTLSQQILLNFLKIYASQLVVKDDPSGEIQYWRAWTMEKKKKKN